MRRRAALLLALVAVLAMDREAAAEKLVVALSTSDIKINSNFTGAVVTVFGAIERDAATVSRPSPYDVAVVVLGPPESVVTRRKDRVLGIWANAASETIVAAPSFYAVNASRDPSTFSIVPVLNRLSLGFDNIAFTYAGRPGVNDPAAVEFHDAFLRLKRATGLYSEAPTGVAFIGDSIFRTTVWIPANVPVGTYKVAAYLFAGEALLAQSEDKIVISKTGFEQNLSDFAHGQALAYGLACVALALFTGWLGGVVFRRD